MDKITDYKDNLSLFLAQYTDSVKLKGIVEAGDDSANDIETALFEIGEDIYLDNAIGAQLDIVGAVFNITRLALETDNDYRARIRAKSALVYSGEPEAIIDILLSTYGATYVHYYPEYPGKYRILTDAVISNQALEAISPAGVGIYNLALIIAEEPTEWFLVDADGNYLVAIQ